MLTRPTSGCIYKTVCSEKERQVTPDECISEEKAKILSKCHQSNVALSFCVCQKFTLQFEGINLHVHYTLVNLRLSKNFYKLDSNYVGQVTSITVSDLPEVDCTSTKLDDNIDIF